MAVVDVGIKFFFVSSNTFLMIRCFCLLGMFFFLPWAVHVVITMVLVGGGSLFACMYGKLCFNAAYSSGSKHSLQLVDACLFLSFFLDELCFKEWQYLVSDLILIWYWPDVVCGCNTDFIKNNSHFNFSWLFDYSNIHFWLSVLLLTCPVSGYLLWFCIRLDQYLTVAFVTLHFLSNQ